MPSVEIKIKLLREGARVPTRPHDDDAASDCYAPGPAPVLVPARGRAEVPLGIAVSIPPGWELQARSRSGLARKFGVRVTHGIGTIDAGFTGELVALLTNEDDRDYTIMPGDRVLQLALRQVHQPSWVQVDDLGDTSRGSGGFGSSGQ